MNKPFDKYRLFAPNYHYRQINKSFFKTYNAFVDARFQKLLRNVEDIVSDYPNKGKGLRILDEGCGDGVSLYLLSKALPELNLFGIDPVSDALSVAKEQIPNGEFKEGRADNLPFESEFFDIVISLDVIEHVEEPERMLSEIKRVAKPNARMIIGTPIRHSKYPYDHNHVQEFFIEDFRAPLKKHFKDINIHESHNLAITLLYSAPTRSFLNFKYLINLLSLVFHWNPFLKERWNKMQMFAYVYAICKK